MAVKTERERQASPPFPSVLWHCWFGDRKGIRPVKSWLGLLMVMIWLELCMSYSSSCHYSPPPLSLAPIKFRMETFWYRLTQFHLENGRWNEEKETVLSSISTNAVITSLPRTLKAVSYRGRICAIKLVENAACFGTDWLQMISRVFECRFVFCTPNHSVQPCVKNVRKYLTKVRARLLTVGILCLVVPVTIIINRFYI